MSYVVIFGDDVTLSTFKKEIFCDFPKKENLSSSDLLAAKQHNTIGVLQDPKCSWVREDETRIKILGNTRACLRDSSQLKKLLFESD